MAEVLRIQKEIEEFYEQKREIKALKNNKSNSVINFEKMTNLKKEVSKNLSEILLTHGENFLTNSFLFQVNNIEQGILNVISDKEAEKKNLQEMQKTMFETGKEIMKYIYSIDILNNSISTGYGIEKRLLDIKDAVQLIDVCKRREYAVQVIREKLVLYQRDFMKLVTMLRGHQLKEEISFQKKQEILNILEALSIHGKNQIQDLVYYEHDDADDDKLAVHYLYLYESIFLSLCHDVGIPLNSYYEELKFLLQSNEVFFESISHRLEFIFRNYEVEIQKFERTQLIQKSRKMLEVKELLGYCCTFESNMNLDVLLEEIQKDHQLPEYVDSMHNKKALEGLLFDLDIQMKDDIGLCNVLDDLRNQMEALFENERYLEIFGFNMKYKSKQLNEYRSYYRHILEESKAYVRQQYLDQIDTLLQDKMYKKYTTVTIEETIEKVEQEIKLLQDALKEMGEQFREFDKKNRYLYMKSIQDRYGLDDLCDLVVNHKKKILNNVKNKVQLEKEKEAAYAFFDQERFEEILRKEILVQLFGDEPELRGRILSYIKTK